MKKSATGVIVAMLLLALVLCLGARTKKNGEEEAAPAKVSLDEYEFAMRDNNRFAVDLYRQVSGEKGNLAFAPYSVTVAMAMADTGAKGETARQIGKVMHFNLRQEKLPALMAEWAEDLATRGGGAELTIANRLWLQKGLEPLPAFTQALTEEFKAGIENVDFGAGEAARAVINKWAALATKGKIKEALPASALTPETKLVLTDAVYFKGKWELPFDPKKTQDRDFFVSAKEPVKVPTMNINQSFWTGSGPGFKLLEMPYAGGQLALVLIVPDEVDGLAKLEKTLSLEPIEKAFEGLSKQKLEVYLPKFKIETSVDLAASLKAMGMTKVFNPGADFSGMCAVKDLFISAAVHKTFLEINEQGTEAGAATSLGVAKDGNPSFRADHPFIYLIRDRKTGTYLFMGRVVDPRG